MLTREGFKRRTYDEILNGKIQKAKELFGEDIDVSDATPLGKYIRINAYDQAEAAEEAEMVYNSIFPNSAVGTALDKLCAFVNITRNPATPARYKVRVTAQSAEGGGFEEEPTSPPSGGGSSGGGSSTEQPSTEPVNLPNSPITTIPIGFLVGTESEIQFYSTEAVTIGADGMCEIIVECTEPGIIGNVDYTTINVVVNPNINVANIQGIELIQMGTDMESDVELRERFIVAREGLGSCNVNSIRAALSKIPGVNTAIVIVNEEDTVDADGRPPHSFECYVAGGELQHAEIAQAIFEKKPIGIHTHGNVSETITDDGGYEHTIKFSHTVNVDIAVLVKIKTTAAYGGEAGKQQITNNLRSYINNLGIGESVILSTLYGLIHAVSGVIEVTELKLSTDNGTSYVSGNVTLNTHENARCTNVTVEVI